MQRPIPLIIFLCALLALVHAHDPIYTCEEDTDCAYLYLCDAEEGICKHKHLWPLAPIEITGSVTVLVMAGLFMAGGLGGGAMMVPILIYLFKYHSKAAIYNAYSIIFGGATGNFLYSLYEVDYDTHKPQIAYDVAALTIPSLLSGTIIGVTLNRAFPEIIILLCLTGLIIFTLTKIFNKAQKLKKKEDEEQNLMNMSQLHDIGGGNNQPFELNENLDGNFANAGENEQSSKLLRRKAGAGSKDATMNESSKFGKGSGQ